MDARLVPDEYYGRARSLLVIITLTVETRRDRPLQINTMNKIKYMAAIFIAIAGLGLQQAEANLIFDQYFYTNGPIGDPSNDTQYLINNYAGPATLTSLFKEN